jgi:nicotinate-nucleotide adenylyltransferase
MEEFTATPEWILFGGGFNPPHLAHFEKAHEVAKRFPEAMIFFMPTYKNSWDKPLIDFIHRLRMSIRTTIDFDIDRTQLVVSPYEWENRIEGPTINVIRHMNKKYPEMFWQHKTRKLAYLIGQDSADLMDAWTEWKLLIKMIPFIVVSRKSQDENRMDWYRKTPHFFLEVSTKHEGVSSTQIREQLKKDRFSPYVTKSTLDYILKENLYV